MDEKIVAWMLKGPAELNQVYRQVDSVLLHGALFPGYKEIAQGIHKYYMRYKVPPPREILVTLLEDEEEIELLNNITEECMPNEIGFLLDEVKKRYNRFLIKSLSENLADADEDIEDLNSLTKRTIARIDRLSKNSVYSEGSFSESVDDRFKKYQWVEENPDAAMGVTSGYAELDDYTWGIKPSEMMVISGASSSGKSLLLMNLAVNAWLRGNDPISDEPTHQEGFNVVYFTLEMNKEQLETRMDACIAKVRHKALSRGQLTDEEKRRWSKSLKFQKQYKPKFYIIDIPRGASVADVEAKYESILGEFEPDLIAVDYLGIMGAGDDGADSDWLGVGKVAESMHEFCRNKNKPVITAAQRKTKNKKAKGSGNGEDANLEDIGRSKMVGDNANIVLQIGNREDEQLREDMLVHLTKNRDGPKGSIPLRKVFDQSRIESFPPNWVSAGEENAV